MDSNYDKEIKNIKRYKIKYFFIGFIVGIIPYSIIILIISNNNINIDNIIRSMIAIVSISTGFINAIILSNVAYKKLLSFLEFRYQIDYNFNNN